MVKSLWLGIILAVERIFASGVINQYVYAKSSTKKVGNK